MITWLFKEISQLNLEKSLKVDIHSLYELNENKGYSIAQKIGESDYFIMLFCCRFHTVILHNDLYDFFSMSKKCCDNVLRIQIPQNYITRRCTTKHDRFFCCHTNNTGITACFNNATLICSALFRYNHNSIHIRPARRQIKSNFRSNKLTRNRYSESFHPPFFLTH